MVEESDIRHTAIKLSPRISTNRVEIAMMLLILVVVSLHALADATQLTISRDSEGIYVETDSKHFAMFGQFTNEPGLRIISSDGEVRYNQNSQCVHDWKEIGKINRDTLHSYSQLRDRYLTEKRAPEESPESYTWYDSFSEDQPIKYSVVQLGSAKTRVFSSPYFPNTIAKVITSYFPKLVASYPPIVATFVYYDGTVVMKTMNCLLHNEKNLIDGIMKIDPDYEKVHKFSMNGDRALMKYLNSNPVDAAQFNSEQRYLRLNNDKELKTKGHRKGLGHKTGSNMLLAIDDKINSVLLVNSDVKPIFH